MNTAMRYGAGLLVAVAMTVPAWAAETEKSRRDASRLVKMFDVPGLAANPVDIDWSALPRLKAEHGVITRGTPEWQFRLHSYLCHYDGRYWAMWSHGPKIEDHPTQHVRYATSSDGIHWSKSKEITGPATEKGMRFISRGLWIREGKLLALASWDEAYKNGRVHFFGKSLELRCFEWDPRQQKWKYKGLVFDDAINNFPPKKLPNGKWMMSRRDHKRNRSMLIGGVKSISDWVAVPIAVPRDGARLEEPFWWILPNGNLLELFRDNSGSKRLYQALSMDHGKTWTRPVRTNFPDARSKFNALRTNKGYYVLVSNPNPKDRNPLCLSVSEDGKVFTRMAVLPVPGTGTFQYPHLIEHDEHLLVVYSHNKRAIEVLKIPISEIQRLRGLESSPQAADPAEPAAPQSR